MINIFNLSNTLDPSTEWVFCSSSELYQLKDKKCIHFVLRNSRYVYSSTINTT